MEKINNRTKYPVDLSGTGYGQVSVIRLKNPNTYRILADQIYECKCSCGVVIDAKRSTILARRTVSCGCVQRIASKQASVKHGDSRSGKNGRAKRLYKIWGGMRTRCSPRCDRGSYHLYYGKGIRVCDEWKEYKVFRDWAVSHGYAENLSIDRIDSNGNYEPSNCRWATPHEQLMNTSRNVVVDYNGEKRLLYELAEELGIDYRVFYERIRRGYSANDVVKYKDKHGAELMSKKVAKFDLEGNLLKVYNSMSEAALEVSGTTMSGNIRKAILGKINHAYGFKWEYA